MVSTKSIRQVYRLASCNTYGDMGIDVFKENTSDSSLDGPPLHRSLKRRLPCLKPRRHIPNRRIPLYEDAVETEARASDLVTISVLHVPRRTSAARILGIISSLITPKKLSLEARTISLHLFLLNLPRDIGPLRRIRKTLLRRRPPSHMLLVFSEKVVFLKKFSFRP